jgi:protein O-mannosyl-transferase
MSLLKKGDIMENKLEKIFLKSWRPLIWITVIIFAVYLPTLFYDIVYLDDNVLIVEDYPFNRNLSNIPQAFSEDIFQTPGGGSFYRPLERLAFMFDAQFGQGALVFVSHFSNLLLHILSVCLLFILLLKFKIGKGTALLLSLVFGIHPLTAQTVSFLSGRNDSLLAIFIFPALIFFLDYAEKQENKYFYWHLAFFILALFTKETAAVLPVICVAYIFIFINWKKIISNHKLFLRLLFGWVIILFFWFAIRHSVLHTFIGNANYNVFLSIYKNLPSIIPAIGKIFLPFNLSVFPVLNDMKMIYGILASLLLIICFILIKNKNYKLIIFGLFWFFVFILPTLIKPIDTVPEFSENRIYLPMFGFIFVVLGLVQIVFINAFKAGLPGKRSVFWRKILLVISLLVIIIFSSVTIYRNRYYKNKINFWKNAVQTSPSFAFNHNNLGAMYYLDGNMEDAETEYLKALQLNPKERLAHNNLGLIFAQQNKLAEAEEEYKKELEINPFYNNALFNLGLLYYSEGKFNEAADQWKKALQTDPNFSDALYALAKLYYNQKDYGQATIYAGELSRRGFPLQNELLQLIHRPVSLPQTMIGQ